MTKAQKVAWLVANCGEFKNEDVPALNSLAGPKLDSLMRMVRNGACEPDDEEMPGEEEEEAPEEEALEEEEVPEEGFGKKKAPAANADWRALAPPDVLETLDYAKKITEREKQALVVRIVANASGDKAAHAKRLGSKSLKELEELASMMPEAPAVNYIGVGGVAANAADKDDFLPLPSSY